MAFHEFQITHDFDRNFVLLVLIANSKYKSYRFTTTLWCVYTIIAFIEDVTNFIA